LLADLSGIELTPSAGGMVEMAYKLQGTGPGHNTVADSLWTLINDDCSVSIKAMQGELPLD